MSDKETQDAQQASHDAPEPANGTAEADKNKALVKLSDDLTKRGRSAKAALLKTERKLPQKMQRKGIAKFFEVDRSGENANKWWIELWIEKLLKNDELDPAITKVDRAIAILMHREYEGQNETVAVARGPIAFGLWMCILIFIILGGWATFAPLDSAAVAGGSVVLDANKKTIQHLEGGIIETLLVQEGSKVKAGAPLLKLSETAARATLDIITSQLRVAKASEARLSAERDNLEKLVFPEDLRALKDDPEVAKILDTQSRLFESRRKSLIGQVDVLTQRIKQLEDEINGLESQQASSQKQLTLINEEVATVKKLVEKGQAVKPRLLALQRKAAELEGNSGEYLANIARARQSIAENDLQIFNLKNERMKEVVGDLRETQTTLADLEERFKASQDVLDRLVITAPQAGVVTGLKYHTIGGVIRPGEPIMDIVPQDDKLIVEANILPQDIDVVQEGLTAKVMLSAYRVRFVPKLKGTVIHISPDRFTDEYTGMPYYKARIEVDQSQLEELPDVDLYPGMPADVFIVTGSRSLMSYLISPLTDSINRAFREE